MIDIKILAIKDVLLISKVSYAPGLFPLALDIIGRDLSGATEVYINDLPAKEFAILSNTRILAQVPDGQVEGRITRIKVLANAPSPTRRSLLSFEAGTSFKGLQGIEKLVQMFTKLLLQTPGTDRFEPTVGGSLLSLIGLNVDKETASSTLSSAVHSAVLRTRDQVISKQSKNSHIPSDERLLTADTDAVGFNPNTTILTAQVAISAVSGQQAIANLTF